MPLQARLGRLLRGEQEYPDWKAAGLCRQLTKWWAALWTFARVDGVEPTNNVSERALRPAVLWRQGSFGLDSEAGSPLFPPRIDFHPAWCRRRPAWRFAERLLTVVATCRQQARAVLDILVAAGEAVLRNSQPPSLIPIPQGC